MPIKIDLDPAIFQWQAKHNERMTYAELSRRTGISLATLHRIKSGDSTNLNLEKLNEICKVLECDVSDIMRKVETRQLSPNILEEFELARKKKNAPAETE